MPIKGLLFTPRIAPTPSVTAGSHSDTKHARARDINADGSTIRASVGYPGTHGDRGWRDRASGQPVDRLAATTQTRMQGLNGFGRGGDGTIYVHDLAGGNLYRIDLK